MASVTTGSLTDIQKRFLVSFQIEDYAYIHNAKFDEIDLSLPPCYAEELTIDVSWTNRFLLDRMCNRKVEEPIVLSREQEADVFLRYNWFKSRIRKIQQAWRASGADTVEDDCINELLDLHANVCHIESQFDRINTPMKVNFCGKLTGVKTGETFNDHWSAVNLAMLKSIRGFDIARGYKFSTYFYRAALSCIMRDRKVERRHKARFRNVTSYVSDSKDVADFIQNIPDSQAALKSSETEHPFIKDLYLIVSGQVEMPCHFALDASEKLVLSMRYMEGRELREEYMAVQAIANKLATEHDRPLSKERVRQILSSAHAKIRTHLAFKQRKMKALSRKEELKRIQKAGLRNTSVLLADPADEDNSPPQFAFVSEDVSLA